MVLEREANLSVHSNIRVNNAKICILTLSQRLHWMMLSEEEGRSLHLPLANMSTLYSTTLILYTAGPYTHWHSCIFLRYLVPRCVCREYLLNSFSVAQFLRANATGTGGAGAANCHSNNRHAYILHHTNFSFPTLPSPIMARTFWEPCSLCSSWRRAVQLYI
jgi:hypothetical protein